MPFLGPPSPVLVVHESTADPRAPPPDVAGMVAGSPADLDGNDDAGYVAVAVDGGYSRSRRCHRRPQRHSPRHHRYLAVIHPRLRMYKAPLFQPDRNRYRDHAATWLQRANAYEETRWSFGVSEL